MPNPQRKFEEKDITNTKIGKEKALHSSSSDGQSDSSESPLNLKAA